MHGSVFLDADGQVIRPALLWNDQRTAAECAEIEEKAGGREALIRMVANPALTGFTAPEAPLGPQATSREHWDRVRQVLLPKDYIRYRLTGTYATEVSDASGTLLLDVANRRWSRELLGKLDLDPALLPPCYESPEVSAKVERAGRGGDRPGGRDAGRRRRRRPAGRGGRQRDRPAGAWSRRRWGPRASSSPTPTELGFDPLGRLQRGCHAVPGRLARHGRRARGRRQLPVVPQRAGQGRGRRWPRQRGDRPVLPPDRRGRARRPGAEGLFFLPYLTGERTPHFDPDAKGAWIGLTVRHGRPHLIRSVLEGATYAMRDSLELIREMGVDDRADPPLRRRCPEPALAADPGRHLRPRRPHAQLDRGPGLRRRPAGPGRHRRVRLASPRRATPRSGSSSRPPSTPRPRRSTTAATPSTASSTSTCASRSGRSARWSMRLILQGSIAPGGIRSRAGEREIGLGAGNRNERQTSKRPTIGGRGRGPRRSSRDPVAAGAAERPAPAAETAPAPARVAPRVWTILAVVGLLVLHYALAARSLLRENPTVDEVVHLPAGITYWQKGTFRLYHHNPPLFKLVAALPVVMAQPEDRGSLSIQELEVEG